MEHYKNLNPASICFIDENGVNQIEEWILVNTHSDYALSTLGRIKSLKFGKEVILRQAIKDEYLFVCLYHKNERIQAKIHQLIAAHFYENPENKPCVNHIDTIKTNNYYKNIEWSTIQENTIHAYENGLCTTFGSSHKCSKLTEEQVLEMRRIREETSLSYNKLAEQFGVAKSTTMGICKRKSWKHI